MWGRFCQEERSSVLKWKPVRPEWTILERWLPVSLSRRTPKGPVFPIVRILQTHIRKPKPEKVFRNPVIYAKELAQRMVEEGISQAELARRLGVSRARISQWLGLLELPEEALRPVEDLGDYWNRRTITERELRIIRRADPATGEQPS